MSTRHDELASLKKYVTEVDKDITMILQNLQWDRNYFIKDRKTSICKYNNNHKMPNDKIAKHEEMCFLKCNGYNKTDQMLPEPLNYNSNGLVKLSAENIQEIINTAAQQNHLFKRGPGCVGPEPLTLERLQVTYTPDERRAIHDAVVNAVPSCHDLSELALPSAQSDGGGKAKSRLEVLAELRDMKRRRAKYRVAARTANYSDVLRSVIRTQMELYGETLENANKILVKSENERFTEGFHERSKDRNRKYDNHYEHFKESYSKQTKYYSEIDKYNTNKNKNEAEANRQGKYERSDFTDKHGHDSKNTYSYNRQERDGNISHYKEVQVKIEKDSYRYRGKEDSQREYRDSSSRHDKYGREDSFSEREKDGRYGSRYDYYEKREPYSKERDSYSSTSRKRDRAETQDKHKEKRYKCDRDASRNRHSDRSNRSESYELKSKHRKHD